MEKIRSASILGLGLVMLLSKRFPCAALKRMVKKGGGVLLTPPSLPFVRGGINSSPPCQAFVLPALSVVVGSSVEGEGYRPGDMGDR